MTEVRIPQLNSNDDEYTLIEWLVEDGAFVGVGEPFVVVETSKATEELEMPSAGYIRHTGIALNRYPIGGVIAYRYVSVAEAMEHQGGNTPKSGSLSPYVLTDGARSLVDEHAIAPSTIAALNLRIVRTQDVRRLIADDSPATRPDRHQQGVVAVVTQSHREIPAAYAVIRVMLDGAERIRTGYAERFGVVVGISELVVAAVGRAATDFPRLYAPYGRDPDVAGGVDVGVTTDLGRGLFLPAVSASTVGSLAMIAERLLDVQKKALRRSFVVHDLGDGGHIAVSLHTEPDIVLATPIIFPQHSCMVSVGGELSELVLDETGGVRSRAYLHLGLSYDHRVVNGREAMAYLRRLKDLLEDSIVWLPESPGGFA
jgi:2-oxoglutarate dehydrogenase E2 component (dihydrolipoamide succinyltransferase)